MASKREINLSNQVTFRNEMLDERKARMEQAGKIIHDILSNYECGDEVDRKLAKALDLLGGRVAV
jgi:hypothetical protein